MVHATVDSPFGPADNGDMAEPARQTHGQEWFVDPRSPDRRMRVTWHPKEGLAVVSFWHRSSCTATFRLPAPDTARLIGVLGDGLAEGWHPVPPATSRSGPLQWLRRRLSQHRPSPAPLSVISGG